uniref:Uncharacterized protein n=1 Tax=Parascaris univalens TaxID=6257 RepID=A0A914ZDH2_PARUN
MAHYTSFVPVPGYSGHIPGEKWQVGKSPSNALQLQITRNAVISSERPTNMSKIEAKNLIISEDQRFTKGADFLDVKHPDDASADVQLYDVKSTSTSGEEANSDSVDSVEAKLNSESEIQELTTTMDSAHIGSISDMFSKSSNKKTSSSLSSEQILSSKQGSGRSAASAQNIFPAISRGMQPQNEARRTQYIQEMVPLSSTAQRDGIHRVVANIPIPGYSGHVPGIRDREVGKNFTMAAKECWERYNELHP